MPKLHRDIGVLSDAVLSAVKNFRDTHDDVTQHDLLSGIIAALCLVIANKSQNPQASTEGCIRGIRTLMKEFEKNPDPWLWKS